MTASAENNGVTGQEKPVHSEQPLLEYTCHPARRNRIITILTTIFLIICVVTVWFIANGSLFMTGLAVVILFGAMGPFYFPTRYYLYDDRLVVKTLTNRITKEWKQYRTFYPDKNGVLISPFVRPSRLENFRGLYIKFEGNRDEVLGIIQNRVKFDEEEK